MLAFIDGEYETVFDFMQDETYRKCIYPAMKLDDPFLHDFPPFIPERLHHAIVNDYTFVAHNARFEQDIWYWICHRRWGWPMPKRWSCTAARSAYWGLRRSLEGAGSDLELPIQKQTEAGKKFINTFCIPRAYKGPKKNGIVQTLWAEPEELPRDWDIGVGYCLDDARTEALIDTILPDLPNFEQQVWELDFKINTRGVPIDTDTAGKAIHFSDHYNEIAVWRFNALTGFNPTQRDRVLEYLNKREELEKLPNLRTRTLSRIVQDDLPHDLRDIISIRLDAARASVKKLEAMRANTSEDGYARGLFVYYGAHTGRASAKRIQPHNFIRGNAMLADIMFKFLNNNAWRSGIGDSGLPVWVEHADMLFTRPLKALAHSMRGFIKAPKGKIIVSGDYSQIEARVLAWLANCHTLLDSYRKGEDTYVRFAADHMYRRCYDDYFGTDGKVLPMYEDERQRAKSAVLGCGFQLGALGFRAYCDNMDIIITEEESQFTINAYRNAYPEISDYNNGLWTRVNWCAIEAVRDEGKVITLWGTEITFHVQRLDTERWWLLITLPSKRHIAYYRPKIDTVNQWGNQQLTFRTDWPGGTQREHTYGGRLTENIVQAVARDICMAGALKAEEAGYEVFGTVHDEVLSLCNIGYEQSLLSLKQCLLDVPICYSGLPLNAEVKSFERYRK
jgi:DNA polymerase